MNYHNAVGIIAEFNPFHEGHAYLIRQAKKQTGCDYAIILMNGDFVQRGEPAIFHKYERAKRALEGGADLILELPVRFGTSSAGDFALGGVLALSSLNFVTHICFGSEYGDIHPLMDAAAALSKESPRFQKELDTALRKGLSFPAARTQALSRTSGVDADILSRPNNILGIEYCLSLIRTNSPILPVTIQRKGQAHEDNSSAPGNTYPSGAALRNEIYRSPTPHLTMDDFSDMLGYALLHSENLTQYKDISPDLSDRMKKNLLNFQSATSYVEQCRTRAFTDGRIRRGMLHCLLDIQAAAPAIPYLRILGMRKKASHLLRQADSSCLLINKLSLDSKKLPDADARLLKQDLFAAHLARQVYCRKYSTELPNEYQRTPLVWE